MLQQKLASVLTEKQYTGALEQARSNHDVYFSTGYPKPALQSESDKQGIERAISYMWVVWLILAIAGGVISLPHTLKTVLGTVDLPPVLQAGYSLAVFVGLELALISIALVSELRRIESGHFEGGKQGSIAGLVNALARRIGVRWQLDTSHLPDKQPASGIQLIVFLFAVALIFNLADTMQGLPQLTGYGDEITFIAKFSAGVLAPVLLLIAGHRFAQEIVRAASNRRRLEAEYKDALADWQNACNASWQGSSDKWIIDFMESKTSLAKKLEQIEYEPAPEVETAYPKGEHIPTSVAGNGNGYH